MNKFFKIYINILNSLNVIFGEKVISKLLNLIKPLINRNNFLRSKFYLILGTSHLIRSIEMTTRVGCPPNCSYCPQNNLLKAYSYNKTASFEDIKNFFSTLKKTTLIKWTGFVEPTSHPDIVEFIEIASLYGHPQMISTTCSGNIDYEALFDRANKKFTNIQFHLPDAHGLMKIKVDKQYLNNLKKSLDTLLKQNFQQVSCNCFGSAINDDVLKLIINHPVFKTKKMRNRITITGQTLSRAGNLSQSDGIGNRKKISTQFDNDNDIKLRSIDDKNVIRKVPSGTCSRQRLNQHVLLPDGSTVLCCMDYSLKTRQSKYKFDFESAIIEHNKQFLNGSYNKFCQECEWFIKD